MKKLVILILCSILFVGCNQGEEAAEVVEQVDLVTEDDAEAEVKKGPDLGDKQMVYDFLKGSYLNSLAYEVTPEMLDINYMDVTGNGSDEGVVTISGWNAAFVGIDSDKFVLLGTTDLAKSLNDVRLEDGFIIFEVVYSGTGTATTMESIYGFDGEAVVSLGQITVEGYEANGDIVITSDRKGSYTDFENTVSRKNEATGEYMTYTSKNYSFDENNFSYSVEDNFIFDVNNNDMVLKNVSVGDFYNGFTVSHVEATDDQMALDLRGNKNVEGRLSVEYNEMYEEDVIIFEVDEPLIEVSFIHEFKDDLEPETYFVLLNFGEGSYRINNIDEFIGDEDVEAIKSMGELVVQVEIKSLYQSAYFRSEGYPRSATVNNIVSLSEDFDFVGVDNTVSIDQVEIGDVFGNLTVSNIAFDGRELIAAFDCNNLLMGELYAFYDELNDEYAYYLESEDFEALTDMNIEYTFNNGYTGNITAASNRLSISSLLSEEDAQLLNSGERLEVWVEVNGYYEWMLAESEGYAEWLVKEYGN